MRTAAALLSLAALAVATPVLAAEVTYGAGVGKAQVVKISELMAHPDKYLGRAVKVEGLITAVCPKRGCWMELASDQEFQAIKIKVDDGVMVFPLDAKGKTATAEGIFTRIEVPAERVAAMKKHDAEEKGIPFDPKSVKGAEVIYRIDGTGAVVR
jgi:hypothetical protein